MAININLGSYGLNNEELAFFQQHLENVDLRLLNRFLRSEEFHDRDRDFLMLLREAEPRLNDILADFDDDPLSLPYNLIGDAAAVVCRYYYDEDILRYGREEGLVDNDDIEEARHSLTDNQQRELDANLEEINPTNHPYNHSFSDSEDDF